ncbi:hypothetical protein J2T17_004942 [Paenibacillus mucilaginosus]|uniref:hypothetical protein n=1 Tax=Paenibacillus mucilaginosus TaxID=61624 RepID=UPI003D1C8B73
MKKKPSCAAPLLLLLLAACSSISTPADVGNIESPANGAGGSTASVPTAVGTETAASGPAYVKPEDLKAVPLVFGRIESPALEKTAAPETASPSKVYECSAAPGLPSCSVHLYEERADNGYIGVRVFLRVPDGWYAAGGSIAGDADSLAVRFLPQGSGPAEDGPMELAIGGAPDDSYAGPVRTLFYYAEKRVWRMQDFQGHDVQRLDLNQDGQAEWVSPSAGSVPPSVGIYRWNSSARAYEYTVVENVAAAAFGLALEQVPLHAYLFKESGEWIIETGPSDRYGFFRQEGDQLVPARLTDEHSRLMDLRRTQDHRH